MESAGALSGPRRAIGLDARLTRQLSVGMKSYVRELARRLPAVAPQYDYVSFERGGNFGWNEQIGLPLAIVRSRVSLVHYLSLYVPLLSPAPSIVTIHDLIHLHFPEYFKAKVRPYYHTVVRWACARAKRVITDDEKTVDDLERFLHVDRTKIRVIPLGVDERFLAAPTPHVAATPYLLYVGNHRPHKNLQTLFEAWSSLPDGAAVDLYVTGSDDFGGELARRNRPDRKIIALGDVAGDELASYYAGALALVQPSFREGFGLPALEAMASGCAVVATEGALPRVLAPAAFVFESGSAQELRAMLERIVAEPALRAQLVRAGRVVAATLTWDRCALATASVYAEVLEEAC
jgi:glycosyltransferase involved in cell wall biosynthesis